MVAEFVSNTVPRTIGNSDFQNIVDDPQILFDWIYQVASQMDILAANSTTNTGDMKILGNDDVPSDWLTCDGATYNTIDYISLQRFLFPDTTSDTFDVPDMQAFILDNTTEEFFTLDSPVKSPFTVIIKT